MSGFAKIAIGVGAVVVLVLAIVAYSVLRTPESASGPIEAIPIGTSAASAATAPAEAATDAPVATAEMAEATAAPADATAEMAEATTAPAEATAAPAASGETVVLEIDQSQSEARFIIDEVLNNAPFTVVGATSQVAGQIAVNPQDASQTQVGVIQVNARDLTTDNDFRNRAIKNRILETDSYEFVTFTPTSISGLPEAGAVGESYTFQMTGDLTIRNVTKPVTFDVTAQATSESELTGIASATINYADFEITIPSVPQVASVSDTVRLEIDFVANAI